MARREEGREVDEHVRTEEQRRLVEEFGLLYEQMGGTRMGGRVSGYLLMCDPPVQSLTRIAEALGVSKAAVSGAVRSLLQLGVVERVSEPGRRGDSYRALPGQMDTMLGLNHVRTLHALLDRGLASVADRDQTHSNYALMSDLRRFSAFLETEIPGVIERWERRQGGGATPAIHDPDPDTTRRSGGTT
ncbi:MAG: MarR family transcriptional regulator [Actinobacteria bacterium]|nr:MarR family transcriptional regulator [Actinomycetota bacterium]